MCWYLFEICLFLHLNIFFCLHIFLFIVIIIIVDVVVVVVPCIIIIPNMVWHYATLQNTHNTTKLVRKGISRFDHAITQYTKKYSYTWICYIAWHMCVYISTTMLLFVRKTNICIMTSIILVMNGPWIFMEVLP